MSRMLIRGLRHWHRDEDGQALVLAALFLVGLVAVAGLVADGGQALAERRDLQNVADAAAAAGAMQLDAAAYRASGGHVVALDEGAARTAAIATLLGEDGTRYDVEATTAQVTVVVARRTPTRFLRLVGIDGVEVSARAVGEPRTGRQGGP